MKKSFLIISTLLSIFLFSCGSKSYSGATKQASYREVDGAVNLKSTKMVMTDEAVVENAVFQTEASTLEVEQSYEQGRKLIKNGNVSLGVESFNNIENIVLVYAQNYNGYVTNTFMSDNYYSATIKVPSQNFDLAMNNVGVIGKVKSRSQNASDVTETYYDLESRIESKKILKDKLENYLKQASSISELMEIERELNNVISELEAMQGRMKRLSNQIDYSTINIDISLPTGVNENGFVWPDLKEKFRRLGRDVVDFFAGFVVLICYIAIYGLPIIILLAFLFWLLFGKIGLLVKLYNLIKRKK